MNIKNDEKYASKIMIKERSKRKKSNKLIYRWKRIVKSKRNWIGQLTSSDKNNFNILDYLEGKINVYLYKWYYKNIDYISKINKKGDGIM